MLVCTHDGSLKSCQIQKAHRCISYPKHFLCYEAVLIMIALKQSKGPGRTVAYSGDVHDYLAQANKVILN